MSFIGEAALSVFFELLFNKLASSDLLNFATEAQVYGEIKKWEKMLRKLRLVLDDAEDKKIQNTLVKEWLGELKHLAYDVEDVLDEFSTECLRRKVDGERQAAGTSRIRKFIPACCTTFTPRAVMFNSDMMTKVGEITTRFKGITEEMKELNLMENISKTSSKVWERPPSSCVQDEPTVYGRDGDKDKILELLFRYETSDAKVGVITIVGMGGMGKTTLAKLVYNDDSLQDHHFQLKAWVCVSDVFDIMRVTRGILESITSQSSDLKELSAVQLQLKNQLAGKKYLLVLDDVWNDNYKNWHALRSPLMDGSPGSKIIVTTRSADVAKMMGTVEYYDLKKISDDDCWMLFKKHAFENRSIVAQPELEKIGREIVNKRCGGLPLAARTLGGLLRSKESRNEWEEVLNNKLWSVLDGKSNILPVLELSYYYLPSHLKRCFAYCAILPKDYEFEQDDIILLWMAEGLIPQPTGKREMEDLGSDYFHDLVSRSIFQACGTNQSQFIMHDLVNDLAQKVAEDAYLRLEDEVNIGENSRIGRVRHSSYLRGAMDGTKRFAPFHNMKCLRTFLPLSHQSYHCYLASCVPFDLLQNLKFLRVLSFRHYNIEELPDSIGDLKHLRYLDLSNTPIQILPESTTSLCNLQTLILKGCGCLRRLPARMDKLSNLRHLNIRGADSIEGIPLEIKELNGLQTLPKIVMSKGFFSLTNLVSLKSLRGELCISNLNNVVDASDAVKAKLKDIEGIRVLELRWDINEDGRVQYDVLDGLQPHRNLNKLIISCYGGTRFPNWIGNPTLNNIAQLRLEDCKKCASLPQLGMLPNLKELLIIRMPSLQRIYQDFYGNNCSNPFPCLEVLLFSQMHNLKEWNASEFNFRVLRELKIEDCENLMAALPSLPMLSVLEIKECKTVALPSLPMLSVLEIMKCKEVDFRCKVDFSSVTRVVLVNVSSIMNLKKEGFLQGLKKFKKLIVSDSVFMPDGSNLECLFGGCPQLKSMVTDEDKEQLQMELAGSELESLSLEGCGVLVKLPAWVQKLMFLRELSIKNCQSLVRFPEGGLPFMLKVLIIGKCESLAQLTVYNSQCLEELSIHFCHCLICLGRRQLPPTLKKLRIKWCQNLKSLLNEEDEGETSSSSFSSSINLEYLEIRESLAELTVYNSQSLEELHIHFCPSLICLGRRQLPPTLKKLSIKWCQNLKSLLNEEDEVETSSSSFSSSINLEDLEISFCESLTSILSESELPATLKYLEVVGCSNLTCVLPGGKLPSRLQSLKIDHCEKVESLAERFDYNTSLETFTVSGCGNLKSLPDGLHNLVNIQIFNLEGCSSIVSFPKGGFHTSLRELTIIGGDLENLEALGQDLPCNLTSLQIEVPKICKALCKWRVEHLNSLRELRIWGGCGETRGFPSDETGVVLPPSLTLLSIRDFPNLEFLSSRGFSNLTSLEYLTLWDCPKLTSFPANGLPDSMMELDVIDCPILKQQYEEGKGPEWPKVRNIPNVVCW